MGPSPAAVKTAVIAGAGVIMLVALHAWKHRNTTAETTAPQGDEIAEPMSSSVVQEQEQEEPAEASSRRGVSVAFLVAFANHYDCWEWPTWRVQRDIVKASTSARKCRFVELDESEVPVGVPMGVGRAQVFVSHCWGGKFGDLVAGVAATCPSLLVWCDLFAVLQWEGNSLDLDFGGVVRRCGAFLLVSSRSPEVEGLSDTAIVERGVAALTEDARRQLTFLRVWCLVEIEAASSSGCSVVMRAGSVMRPEDFCAGCEERAQLHAARQCCGYCRRDIDLAKVPHPEAQYEPWCECPLSGCAVKYCNKACQGNHALAGHQTLCRTGASDPTAQGIAALDPEPEPLPVPGTGGQLVFVPALKTLVNLQNLVDVEAAGASVESDRQRILAQVRAGKGGAAALNALVVDACAGAVAQSAAAPLVCSAACGEPLARAALLEDPTLWNSAVRALVGTGDVELLRALLARGADAKAANPANGYTASHNASRRGSLPSLELLLGHGADVDCEAGDGVRPLHLASQQAHAPAVELLLACGADPNGACADKGQTPLMYAAKLGRKPCVEALLRGGALLSPRDKMGWSALTFAANSGQASTLEILLAHDCSRGEQVLRDPIESAVVCASMRGHAKALDLLLEAGADPNAVDGDGWTALAVASRGDHPNGSVLPILRSLLSAHADANQPSTPQRFTALGGCAQQGADSVGACDLLLAAGADLNAVDGFGWTALLQAAAGGNAEALMVRLVAAGASVAASTDEGRDALSFASAFQLEGAVEALLGAGTDVNVADAHGITALMRAAMYGHVKIVQVLLRAKANPDLKHADGLTALAFAKHFKHTAVAALLE